MKQQLIMKNSNLQTLSGGDKRRAEPSRYLFGAARELYARNTHPRVMLGPEDIVRLRKQIRSGDGLKIMTALRGKVRRLVGFVAGSQDLVALMQGDGSHHSPGSQVGRAITDIAMVAALDEDADSIAAVRRLFAATCASDAAARKGWFSIGNLALSFDLLYPHLSETERRAYTAIAATEIQRLIHATDGRYFKNSGGNMGIVITLSAIPLLLAIQGEPGVPPMDGELAHLVQCLEASLHTTTNPDGYPEEDIGYGTGVAAFLSQKAEWLRRAGIYDVYRKCPRFMRFGRAILHFVQPWGEDLSNTGDHGDDFMEREFILARLATETRDPTLLWLLGTLHYHHGKVHPENTLPEFYIEVPLRKGFRTHASFRSLLVLDELKGEIHPAKAGMPTQFMDRGRGIVSFRSGWKEDDTFVVFDGSQRNPSAQGHSHSSCGHFSLSAVGEYFSIDTGRYQIEQNQHSVVLIDGKSGRSTHGDWTQATHPGNLIDYCPGDFVDFAAVDSSHQHDCYWARRYLGLVKGEIPLGRGIKGEIPLVAHGHVDGRGIKGRSAPAYAWTVEDINKANDWAEFWWQLQTSPENVITTRENSATICGWRHGNLLDVHFALPAPESYPKSHTLAVTQDVSTTSSYKYIPNVESSVKRYKRPADMLHGPVYARPRLLGKVGGYNGRFMSIMLPRRKDEPSASVEQIPSIDNSLAVKITFSTVQDTLIFAYEHNLLEADDVRGRGQWCVVRRSRATGKLLAFEMGNGTALAVGQRRVKLPHAKKRSQFSW